ncbi:MAG: metal ABC transporter ATP-binding protein [Chloroflexi bacterium]|nr:metal ABC transporter ATP-binding protein [Chloroflexota bacterium]
MIYSYQDKTLSPGSVESAQIHLRASHLAVGYDNIPIVQGITLQLDRGQSLALVGMNGSGKSTFLKTIVGLLPPLQGELELLGARNSSAARRVAYLGQFQSSGFVLPLRTIDVVRMGRFAAHGLLGRLKAADHELIADSMRRMDVHHLAHAPVRSLSGGQRQRVYLAQVLARRANLLVLDEPTASLDAAGRAIFARVIEEEVTRGASVVIATHDIREAGRCDHVMLLAQRVVGLGSPKDVLTPQALLETFGVMLATQD